jgi:hypothetical protein
MLLFPHLSKRRSLCNRLWRLPGRFKFNRRAPYTKHVVVYGRIFGFLSNCHISRIEVGKEKEEEEFAPTHNIHRLCLYAGTRILASLPPKCFDKNFSVRIGPDLH